MLVINECALIAMIEHNFLFLLHNLGLIGITLFKKLIIAIKEENIENIKEEIAKYIAISLCYQLCFFKYSFINKKSI